MERKNVTLKIRILRIVLGGVLVGVLGLGLLLGGSVYALKLPTWGALPAIEGGQADPNRLQNHVVYLSQETYGRHANNLEVLNQAADYVEQALTQPNNHVTRQAYCGNGLDYYNLVARFGPAKGPLWVVGAHYDVHKNLPGADDNASGVAGLLELARLLGQVEVPHPIELVAYSTEEAPFYGTRSMGSYIHAASLKQTPTVVRGMICLEMIGYYSEVQGYPYPHLQYIYPKEGDFIAVISRWQDRDLIRHVKRGFYGGTDLLVQSVTMAIENSDHMNYWKQGYPAVMITDTAWARNRNYHTDKDTADTLDYDKMAGVVDGVFCTIMNQ